MNSLRWGRVEAIHPEDYSVDVVMTDDGSRLAGVQVLTPFASSNTGCNDMAQPSGGGEWSLTNSRDRDVLACVAFFSRFPVVIGFRFPQVCQMLFKEIGRRINRHSSDVYSTIDAEGNTELYHPSGTYLRIGTSPGHDDLTGKDFDGNWKISKNTGKAVHVHLTVANAGSEVATLDIDPSGNVTLEHAGDFNHKVGGSYSLESAGAATIKAPSVTQETPQSTVTGAMAVQGEGASGAVSTFSGTIRINNGDVIADNISLKGHGHTGNGPGNRTSNAVP